LRVDPRIILSLDFRGDVFQGPQAFLDDEDLWPRRLIVMTLARVGSDAGPDLTRLASIIAKAGSRAVYAAGGLRGKEDLLVLRQAGATGVLVASALHDGRLSRYDLVCTDK
jgi:phosphoribosylformimino-5-aminoimidazole carboxamide ribotide isomerase